MNLFIRDRWQDWARDWGLTHRPQRGFKRRTEQVLGERNGLLLRAGWGVEQYPGLTITVRFPKTLDVQRLRQALIDDATLDALPGKGAARRSMAVVTTPAPGTLRWGKPPEFSLTDSALTWRRVFAWSTPNVAKVQSWVDALVQAVARVSPTFDKHCETCHVAAVSRYVLVDDLPVYLCAGCQQRLEAEGDMAERTYEMTEANHGIGAALAGFAAIVGAAGWAALSALTQREFAAAAIGIGALIAWGYKRGAGRVDLAGRAISATFTLLSVSLGELLLFAWWVAKARPDIGFQLGAGWFVYRDAWRTHAAEQVFTLFLAGVGAWVAFQALQRPKLKRTIRQADEPAAPGRRAA